MNFPRIPNYNREQWSHIAMWGGLSCIVIVATCTVQVVAEPSVLWPAIAVYGLAVVLNFALVMYFVPGRYAVKSLYALLPTLVESIEIPPGADMRCAFWVPDKTGYLKQITNYWPDNERPATDVLHEAVGLVGRVSREQTAKIYMVESGAGHEAYQADLISQFGYTRQTARRVNQNQRSFLAVPIVSGDSTCAILYCDSSSYQLFDEPQYDQEWLHKATRILSLIEPLF